LALDLNVTALYGYALITGTMRVRVRVRVRVRMRVRVRVRFIDRVIAVHGYYLPSISDSRIF
jgi:hypothetical protein